MESKFATTKTKPKLLQRKPKNRPILRTKIPNSNNVVQKWPCLICTYLNAKDTNKCKMCLTPRQKVRSPIKRKGKQCKKRRSGNSNTSIIGRDGKKQSKFHKHPQSKSDSNNNKYYEQTLFPSPSPCISSLSSSSISSSSISSIPSLSSSIDEEKGSVYKLKSALSEQNNKLFHENINNIVMEDKNVMDDIFNEISNTQCIVEPQHNDKKIKRKNRQKTVKRKEKEKKRRAKSKEPFRRRPKEKNDINSKKKKRKNQRSKSILVAKPKKRNKIKTFSNTFFMPIRLDQDKNNTISMSKYKHKKKGHKKKYSLFKQKGLISISCSTENNGSPLMSQSVTSPLAVSPFGVNSPIPKFEGAENKIDDKKQDNDLLVPPTINDLYKLPAIDVSMKSPRSSPMTSPRTSPRSSPANSPKLLAASSPKLLPNSMTLDIGNSRMLDIGNGTTNWSMSGSVYSELRAFLNINDDSKQEEKRNNNNNNNNDKRVVLEMHEESVQKHESILLEILKCTNDNDGDAVINAITIARCDVLCYFLPLIAFILCSSDKIEWRKKLLNRLKDRIIGQTDLHQAVKFFIKTYGKVKSVKAVFAGLCEDGNVYDPHSSQYPRKGVIEFWKSILLKKEGESVIIPQNTIYRDPIKQLSSPIRRVVIKKILNSNTKPLLIECYGLDKSMTEFISSRFILKYGDDLRKDKGCLLVFKWINHLWQNKCNLKYKNKFIKILTYKVVPISTKYGCIELIPNCIPLRDILSIKDRINDNVENRINLIRSAAGSYIASYIMGIRDRHFDNILIRQTDFTLFHIDFNYVLGEKIRGLDANKFGITRELYDIFGKKYYKIFIDLTCAAFIELRKYHLELINFACLAFSYIYDYKIIKQHILKELRMNEDDKKAINWLKIQLQNAPFNKQTQLKNTIHKFATR